MSYRRAKSPVPSHRSTCSFATLRMKSRQSRDGGLKGRLALIILAPASANLHRDQQLCRRRPQGGSRRMVAAPSPAKVQRGLILPTMPVMPCTAKSEAASTCTRQVAQRRPARARRLSRLRGPATVSTSGRRAPGSPATSSPWSWQVVLFKEWRRIRTRQTWPD